MMRIRRPGGTALAALIVVVSAAVPVHAAAAYNRSVRVVPHCGYSKVLHREYACRVVTVRGPGYTRVDWFSMGLGERTYPWERLVWQYRWDTHSSRRTACRRTPDGLPARPTYRVTRWVTAERLTIYEAAHTVTARSGAKVRAAARVRRLPWGRKELTIRKVSVRACSAPSLGVQVALNGGADLPPLSRLTVVADQSLSGVELPLDVVAARTRTHAAASGVVALGWQAPETVLASGVGGPVATTLDAGLPGAPGAVPGQGATVSVPIRSGAWTLALKGSSPSAPRAVVTVIPSAGGVVPVLPGQGVLFAVPGGKGLDMGLHLRAPAGIGAVVAARVSEKPVAGRGGGSLSIAPLALNVGATSATLATQGFASPGAFRLEQVTVIWTGAGGAQARQSFDLAVVGVRQKG